MNELAALFASSALSWYNGAYAGFRGVGSRANAAFASLSNRFQSVSTAALNNFADIAERARGIGRDWGRSSRDDYAPDLERIPDISRSQRRAGLRGATVLEYQVRFKLCYRDGDGNLLREEWVRDQEDFGLHASRREVLDRFAELWERTPELLQNERYRRQKGEVSMDICGFVTDSIIRKIAGT